MPVDHSKYDMSRPAGKEWLTDVMPRDRVRIWPKVKYNVDPDANHFKAPPPKMPALLKYTKEQKTEFPGPQWVWRTDVSPKNQRVRIWPKVQYNVDPNADHFKAPPSRLPSTLKHTEARPEKPYQKELTRAATLRRANSKPAKTVVTFSRAGTERSALQPSFAPHPAAEKAPHHHHHASKASPSPRRERKESDFIGHVDGQTQGRRTSEASPLITFPQEHRVQHAEARRGSWMEEIFEQPASSDHHTLRDADASDAAKPRKNNKKKNNRP